MREVMKYKLTAFAVGVLFMVSIIGSIQAAELVGFMSDDGRVWHVFKHEGAVISCLSPHEDAAFAQCQDEAGNLLQCEALQRNEGFIGVCKPE